MFREGPFHAGERALQDAAGVTERMTAVGTKVIRDHMPEQHRELFEKLPTIFVGTLDDEGQPWATLLCGAPRFVHAPDDRTLSIAALPVADDPARAGLRIGAAVGLLGIEPRTRRRNRANGLVVDTSEAGWSVRVLQSFGNCPKYIHARDPIPRPERVPAAVQREGAFASEEARRIIEESDTIFVASSSDGRLTKSDVGAGSSAGVDVSHRGGRVGFVQLRRSADGDELSFEDYAGNLMFNTLGNLLLWPSAGLLLVNWERGDVLQFAATATIDHERRLRLRLRDGVLRRAAMPLSWSTPEAPPQLRCVPRRRR